MSEKSVGLIELSSVAAGFEVADTMLKAGNVRLLLSRSICSGKYMVLIGGEMAGVEAAVAAGCDAAGGCLIDSFVAPNVHPDVFEVTFPATKKNIPVDSIREAENRLAVRPHEGRAKVVIVDPADMMTEAAANALLNGLCHSAIVAGGYSPALGFIHTGKQMSFVYDIADLYKTEITIPASSGRCAS